MMLYYFERVMTFIMFTMLFILPFLAGYCVGKWVERSKR
jgi:hypothetical protein